MSLETPRCSGISSHVMTRISESASLTLCDGSSNDEAKSGKEWISETRRLNNAAKIVT